MSTVYDNDVDKDAEAIKGLEESLHGPSATESGSKRLAEQRALQRNFDAPDATESGSQKIADAKELKQGEEAQPDRSGFSAKNDMDERLGRGYTGKGSKQSKSLTKLYASNSAFKRKVAIAGAAAGGSVVAAVLVFLALLPLKIESIVNVFENKFAATSESAISKETDNLFSNYVKHSIIPSLNAGTCHRTIDPSCVITPSGTGPIGKMYAAWSKGRIENKLATKYGLILGKNANGLYVNFEGTNIGNHEQFNRLRTDPNFSFFDLAGTKQVSSADFRLATRNALKDATLWDKLYFRYKVTNLRRTYFHQKACVFFCDTTDKLNDTIATKKLAGKLIIAQRVLGPISQSYSLLVQCMLTPAQCDTKLTPSTNINEEQSSKFNQKLDSLLSDYIAKNGPVKLAELAAKAGDINKLGLGGYLSKTVATEVAAKLGGAAAGDVAGEAAGKVVPVVGWVSLALNLRTFEKQIVPNLKYLSYAQNTAGAAALAGTFVSAAAELKSGNVDMTEIGSLSSQLETNTPYYNSVANASTGNGTTAFLQNISGNAYADTTTPAYLCENNKPVPNGDLVCDEEKLTSAGTLVDSASKFVNQPFIKSYNAASDTILAPLDFLNKFYNEGTGLIGAAAFAPCKLIAPCNAAATWAASWGLKFFHWLYDQFIPNPYKNLTPGRTTDLTAAGFDVIQNKSCQDQLGCAKLSDQQVAKIQGQVLADQKAAFNHQPLFARMFSTSNSYSLVSRLAVAMPTNLTNTTNNGVAALLSNPFGRFGSMLTNVFSTNHAFAMTPQGDPFGITQYGYDSVPDDPESYWDQNCKQNYNEQTGVLDSSAWFNSQTQDTNTGQPVATKSNPCMLIMTTVQSAGGLFDASLVPASASNGQTTDTTNQATSTTPSGDAKSLAAQVVANKNIIFENDSDKQNMIDTSQGKAISCTDDYGTVTLKDGISSELSKFMIQLAGKYQYRISALYSGHGGHNSTHDNNGCSDGGRHPLGRAIDVDQVNGKRVDYGANQAIVREFAQYALTVLPKGSFVNKMPVSMGGIGQQQCFSPLLTYPAGINAFADACNHLHLDVGTSGASLL